MPPEEASEAVSCGLSVQHLRKTFFSDFWLLFGVIFGALSCDFGDVGATYFSEGVRDRFGTVFGSISEVFWTDFGRIFGIILEVFL